MKAFVIFIALVTVGFWCVKTWHVFHRVLIYAKENPSPSTPKVEYYMGMFYYTKGNYPNALEAFNYVLTDHPTSYYAPKALFRVGTTYEEMEEWTKARETYEKHKEQYPESPKKKLVERKIGYLHFKR